ncbi:hypothetical protein O181_005270 [Austropuccinia psidii MF-1]|uniref:C2H2-type domain-containing protein n=1 Tax=Austropuccinia psidii MF-1 TaxID=1389203 RepID=A0A9Q3BIM9_9BASI|nr:hypothetical protein [Austropuccinia psidii MF-1]
MSEEKYLGFESLDSETRYFMRDFLAAPPESFTYNLPNDLFDRSFTNIESVVKVLDCRTTSTVTQEGARPTLTRLRQDESNFNHPQNLCGLRDMSSSGSYPLFLSQSMSMNNLSSPSQSSASSLVPTTFPQLFEDPFLTQPIAEWFGFAQVNPLSWDFSLNTTANESIDVDKQYRENDRRASENFLAYDFNDPAPHNWVQLGALPDVAGPSSMGSYDSLPQSYENLINFESSYQGSFQKQKESLEVGSSNSATLLEGTGLPAQAEFSPFVSSMTWHWDTPILETIGFNKFEGMIFSTDSTSVSNRQAPGVTLYDNTETFQTAHVTFLDTSGCTNPQTNLGENKTSHLIPLERKRKTEDGDVDSGSLALAASSATKKKVGKSDKLVEQRKRRRKDEFNEPVTYTCAICNTGKIIKRKANFERHLLTHLPKCQRTRYKCRVAGCPKEYYYYHDIQKHEKTHPELFK